MPSCFPKKYETKQSTKLSIFWRQTNPIVHGYKKRAVSLTSRNRKLPLNTPSPAVRNEISEKVIKLERLCGFINILHDRVDDNLEETTI